MATTYWLGTADAVAQVTTVQITADDAATTYILTVGGVTVSVAGTGTGVNDTADALKDAWNNSTHPFFTAVTATVVTDTITLTADTAGVPFVVASSKSGGAGTIGAASTTTANSGPNDWGTAENWSGGAVPVNADDVIFADNGVNVSWGLAQSGVTLDSLTVKRTYTGKIGLNRNAFATSSDADTVDTAKDEYRDIYLAISSTVVDIGEHFGPGNPAGSSRIMLDVGSNASTIQVFGTSNASAEIGKPAVRLLANHATTDVFVRLAPGGVGVAVDEPGETSTIRKVSISDTGSSSRVETSDGVTLATWEQSGGNNVMQAAATVTTVTMDGGTLRTEGDFTITTLDMNSGTFNSNHTKTAGNAITTINSEGGTLDFLGSNQTRTLATVNLNKGSTFRADGSVVTITTLNVEGDRYALTVN